MGRSVTPDPFVSPSLDITVPIVLLLLLLLLFKRAKMLPSSGAVRSGSAGIISATGVAKVSCVTIRDPGMTSDDGADPGGCLDQKCAPQALFQECQP